MKRPAARGVLLALTAAFVPRSVFAVESVVALEGRGGVARAPYVTAAFPVTSGYGAVLLPSVSVAPSPAWALSLRVPWAAMRVEQPAGSLYAEAALGNPELGSTFSLGDAASASGEWRFALSVGFPLAEHATRDSQLEGRALALADALYGFGEPALFTPGVVPLVPRLAWGRALSRWRFDAELAVPLLPRVSAASLPASSERRALGVVPTLRLDADFALTRFIALRVAPLGVLRLVAPAGASPERVSIALAAGVLFGSRTAFRVDLTFLAPLSGVASGSTFAFGVAPHLAF